MSTSALQLLRALLPADCVIHVGAGRGVSEIHAWHDWDINRAWLIDADQDRMAWAGKEQNSGAWKVLEAVLADKAGPVDFYQASNPAEDGLLSPEQLRAQWANLRAISSRQTTACTLDQLLASSEPSHNAWLFVDCLPADLILAGATQTLANTRVVCARTLGPEGEQATTQALAAQGFVQVARLETNHPDLGHLLFARNVLAQHIELAAQVDQLKAELKTLKLEKDGLVATHEAGIQANAQALAQSEAKAKTMAEELERTKAQLQTLIKEQSESAAAHDADAKAYAQKLANQEAQAKALADEIKQLKAAQQALQQEKETAADAHAANAKAHTQALAQRDAQNQALTTELNHLKLELQALEKDKAAVLAAREAEAAAHAQAQASRDAQAKSLADEAERIKAERQMLSKDKQVLALAQEADAKAKAQAQASQDAQDKALAAELDHLRLKQQELEKEKEAFEIYRTEQIKALAKEIEQIKVEQQALKIEKDNITAAQESNAKAKDAETAATNKAKSERDALAKENQALKAKYQENQERMQHLESANQDLQNRQYQQHEELVKAEAQIELIKDLLLREQGI